jgi:hypothetical protein
MNSSNEELLVGFGDVIDRIVCTPVGTAPILKKGREGPYKLVYSWMKVYDDTRKKYGRPLTLLAAEKLKEKVKEGDFVIIITNSLEMDGPPGAAALARALIVGLKAIPIILSNYQWDNKQKFSENYISRFENCLPQTCIGAGLLPVTNEKELMEGTNSLYSVLIQYWSAKSVTETLKEAKKLLDKFNPKAIITVEAVSCNIKSIRHGALGNPVNPNGSPEEEIVRWNQILDLANERGILTIASGDNGNECGFGTIKDILTKHHKFCANCNCPCGEGIVSAGKADIVIPATSSNWGCYGIEACLARILNNPNIMHNEYTENRILLNCANVGICDGASEMVTPTTDGSSHETGIYTVGQLRQTVVMSFVELVRESRTGGLSTLRDKTA